MVTPSFFPRLHNRLVVLLFAFSFAVATNSSATAAGLIDQIIISGNNKTVDSIILQELLFKPGQSPSKQAIESSRQAIMDLGLFESVGLKQQDGQLTITVKEKRHDWYILPRINRNGEGDITLGAAWRANNLNGRNQKMKLTVVNKQFENASKDEEVSVDIRYAYPRIAGTAYSASIYANQLNVGIDETRNELAGRYDRDRIATGFRVGRWLSKNGHSHGWHAELGGNYAEFQHQHESGDAGLLFDATVVSATARLEYDDVEDHLYSRAGFLAGIEIEHADESLGSDVDFTHGSIYYRRYMPLAYRQHANLNYRVLLASGNRSIFGGPIYELSGSQAIRGIPRETLEGDAFLLVNIEYLTPLFNRDKIRGGVLFDFGNAYQSLSDITDGDLEYGYGLALRWQLKSWVDTEIRLDIAKGSGLEGKTKVYLSTNSFF